ncbi:hypothetical protein O181_002725 [Austropuccinia psidii MF-1]|uniref:Uncharacterized protein n=1 Tax=Austropuccinia psidii MF-1 TaxID=1389203 RepID=A0A9Q3BD06_9BASI|nr:hypothetical protein [Austropuccinia psidii MF-1]
MPKKGWDSKVATENLRKDLVDMNPTATNFKIMLDKMKRNSVKNMNESCEYANPRWDKGYKTPDFKIGHLILLPIFNFDHMKGPKRLSDSFVGRFIVKALNVSNVVRMELKGMYNN